MADNGRSYSDPSYGSKKVIASQQWSAGTRPTALVENIPLPPTSIEITDFNILNTIVGTGGSSQWVLAVTSSLATAAIGTISMTGTTAANSYTEGAVTATKIPQGGQLHLYSVLSTANPDPILRFNIEYAEYFLQSDT